MAVARTSYPNLGIPIALLIILLWISSSIFLFTVELDFRNPLLYFMFLAQTHLYTGLFITAHDAMHGAVSPKNPKLNHFFGWLCANLFIFNSYKRLKPNHYKHHRLVATEGDPDFHSGNPNFFVWYFQFLKEYITIWQLLLAAITFNVLTRLVGTSELNMIIFWMIPAFLSTFQLFYFGTYLPHRGEHDHENKHKSRSQAKNHIWAFLSCYFFGYHYEHHDSPMTPWWMLWREKS